MTSKRHRQTVSEPAVSIAELQPRRITIQAFAKLYGISVSCARKRAREGVLKTTRDGYRVMVDLQQLPAYEAAVAELGKRAVERMKNPARFAQLTKARAALAEAARENRKGAKPKRALKKRSRAA
ncbi:MAG: hypothetical protein IT384_10400 [Deltaproteobacteria bacterium]|nr:hypothetical protein [Deltaproteobacteria bacterium]